ncbi:MAG TPA: PorV/PorQ family protein [Bacteroidetes bacterium]|nr:PorV/PorQ family protein [Bacteroidota bacterium]
MRLARKILVVVALALLALPLHAQEGGIASIFSKGVGSRQMALGGAVVAFPQDPSTIYWNPAGLEYLSQKSVTLFYANFLQGTSYNFVGFAYPTLYIGTFGIGVARVATGGIVRRGFLYESQGEFGYDESEFYLSYGKFIRDRLSVGANVKFERQVIDNYSALGFGLDVGAMYLLDSDSPFLSNLRLGLMIHNAYAPRLKPGEVTDFVPHRIRVGIAKPVSFSEGMTPMFVLLGVERGDRESLRYAAGLEYTYKDMGMLRLGFNSDGLTFGAGTVFRQFQLDYAYAKLGQGDFGASHRISFTVRFGKTREEMLAIEEERRRQEIERQVALQQERERQARIRRLLSEGKQYYANGDYTEAMIKFSQVLELDKGNREAEEMLAETNARIREIRKKELEQQLAQIQEERRRQQIEENVNRHVEAGLSLLKQGKYSEAIDEFNRALEYQPNSKSIHELIAKARDEINKQVANLIKKADNAAKRGDYNEAIRYLNDAQMLAQKDEVRRDEISKRISELEKKLNVYDFYQQGLYAYRAERWQEAMKSFEKALKLDPNNPDIRHYYQEARRRALAREEPLTPEMEKQFVKAFQLYIDDHIQEAIDIWEQLLQIQPYNKRIIDAIDKAKKELEKRRKLRNKQ